VSHYIDVSLLAKTEIDIAQPVTDTISPVRRPLHVSYAQTNSLCPISLASDDVWIQWCGELGVQAVQHNRRKFWFVKNSGKIPRHSGTAVSTFLTVTVKLKFFVI